MNTGVRTALQAMKTPSKQQQQHEKEKEKPEIVQESSRLMNASAKAPNRCRSRRERKIALQQDVDKLKKKLRHEENVHRALERAFTRPLGALPRLPPYLPPYTLELLAEVAVLEEEVVWLEEQVVNFRQGLYQEAIYISSSKKPVENGSDLYTPQNFRRPEISKPSSQEIPMTNNNPSASSTQLCSDLDQNGPSSNRRPANEKRVAKKPNPCSVFPEDRRGKENQLNSNSPMKNNKQSPQKKVPRIRTSGSVEKRPDPQLECKANYGGERAEESAQIPTDVKVSNDGSRPNKTSEDILMTLLSIFSRMSVSENTGMERDMIPSVSGFIDSSDDTAFRDPYGICSEFGRRDIGPYKHFHVVEQSSLDLNLVMGSTFLRRKLKLLFKKLESVDLRTLTHQEKLAFWINIYNSCMMNAFLEHGIPDSPQVVVTLMQKATINVGGHSLSAMMIEHFVLRLPYHLKYTFSKGEKNDEMAMRSILGLDWPEPMVTFALSCGSWSSPAVRVYTASQVENELERAKRDYLQAAVGISSRNRMAIPKLLDWYLLDFAKDVESLMDWICLQLPSGLRNEAVKCLERGRREAVSSSSSSQFIQVMPYDFSFRYILAS